MKLVGGFLIKNNIFSFKLGCGTNNTKFKTLFFSGTVKIAIDIST